MKSLKTILGIALSVGGLGTAATVTGVSIAQKTNSPVTIVEASEVVNGNKRINVIMPSGSNQWIFNDNAVINCTGVSASVGAFDFQVDGDIGNAGSHEAAGVRQLSYKIDNEYKYFATKSLGSSFTTDWWNITIRRHNGGSTYNNPQECQNGKVWINNANTFYYDGNSLSAWGYYYKVALHTGLSLETTNYDLKYANNYMPANPEAIFGYTFEGWYKDSDFKTKYTQSTLTGDINLYAKYTLNKEAYLASSLNEWKANDDNYLLSPAENSQYYIDVHLEKDEEFKIVYKGDWIGWEQVDTTSKAITSNYIVKADADDSKSNLKAATAGQYEIYFKTTAGSNKIWIQQDSTAEATTWAQSFLDATGSICATGGTSANHLSALSGIWSTHSGNYNALTIGAQGLLKIGTANETIADAHDRYVHIMTRYAGQLSAFGDWTVGGSGSGTNAINTINSNNSGIIIAVVSTVIIVTATGAFFILRKKKHN